MYEIDDDNDDEMVGRILSRREIIGLFGITGLTLLAGCGIGSSSVTATNTGGTTGATTGGTTLVVTPAVTEGPFFVDEKINRSDITTNTTRASVLSGLPLSVKGNVQQINGTTVSALPSATVDIWHTDALGIYSDVSSGVQSENTTGQTFLRGYQVTDASGSVQFASIYPGWYQGRAVHIHFKVRLYDASGNQTYEFTSQFFFDDTISDTVFTVSPYNTRGTRSVRNATDNVYNTTSNGALNGPKLLLALTQDATGYTGSFNVVLQMS